ncbi:MAG: DPP IV N-terminal domain-containing protein [Pseudomonadota bacterium]|nr:DPP IV N-terminal domain-containing protein [Pseudomonadota bacterium]
MLIFRVIFTLMISLSGHAMMDIELTRGYVGNIHIQVQDGQPHDSIAKKFRELFVRDMETSGRISVVPQSSKTTAISDYQVVFSHEIMADGYHKTCMQVGVVDRSLSNTAASKCLTYHTADWVPQVHRFSAMLYQDLIGQKGIFLKKLVYVRELKSVSQAGTHSYQLEVSDFDGGGARTLLYSKEPIMSPVFSPDGSQILYVSYEHHRSQLMLYHLNTGKSEVLTDYPGVNGAPSWSPDGKRVALSLSLSGVVQVYVMDVKSKELQKISKGWFIETDPVWTSNQDELLFVSNRGMGVQIYRVSLSTGSIKRLTYHGSYNVSPSLSSDGQKMVFLSRVGHKLGVVLYHEAEKTLAHIGGKDVDESPVISKDGEYVLFGSLISGRRFLMVKSLSTGLVHRVANDAGDIKYASWSHD